jgi:hypothetical protein
MANNIYQDIRLENGDLYYNASTGDFDIEYSDDQNVEDIIQSFPGDWRQYPQIGVGCGAYLNSSGQEQKLSSEVILHLKSDGFIVDNPTVKIANSTINIKPNAYRP